MSHDHDDTFAKQVEDPPIPLFGGEQDTVDPRPWWLKDAPKPRAPRRFDSDVTSPTKIASAEECGLAHTYRYKDKREAPSGPEAVVGKLVHGAYDDAGRRRASAATGPRHNSIIPCKASVAELLFLLEHQEAQLARENDLDYRPTDAMFAEARGIIQARGPVDFSNTYSTELLVDYRIPGRQTLRVGGKIDRVDLYYKGEVVDAVVVVDYKSDRDLWADEKLETNAQPGVYLGWARREWPKARSILFELDFVRLGEKQRIPWTPEYERAAFSRIVSAQNLMDVGYDKPTVGDHCRLCPYRDGDAEFPACPAYAALVKRGQDKDAHVGGLGALKLSALLREYYVSNELYKIHKQRRSDVRAAIEAQLGLKTRYNAGFYAAALSKTRVDPAYTDVVGVLLDIHEVTGRPLEEIAAVVCQVKHQKVQGLIADVVDDAKRAQLGVQIAGRQGGRLQTRSLRVTRKKGLW
jgi:hypothetical protein